MYILIAVIIAILIILIYYFLFPGIFLIYSANIDGYWTDLLGNIYKLTPTSRYTFSIIGLSDPSDSGGRITGTIFNNKIQCGHNYGIFKMNLNTIIFNDGQEWYKTEL
jgi:hypothetical protein|uniref:Uncharacterized protein n=1 Tax=viral metagenome TaxID=1070528 RepID=A0A6C0I199_9ZZZZ